MVTFIGVERTRTVYLQIANLSLYQVSYYPVLHDDIRLTEKCQATYFEY